MKQTLKSDAGIKLTAHEKSCVRALQRLAKRWDEKPNRLWLFSANSCLHVMLGEGEGNPEPEFDEFGCVNKNNQVITVDIPKDGGDW